MMLAWRQVLKDSPKEFFMPLLRGSDDDWPSSYLVLVFDPSTGWFGYFAIDDKQSDLAEVNACILHRSGHRAIVVIDDVRRPWCDTMGDVCHAALPD